MSKEKNVAREPSQEGESHGDSEVMKIVNSCGEGDARDYKIMWKDGSKEWKPPQEIDLYLILVDHFDQYIEKYPIRCNSYAEFTARDIPFIEYAVCAIRAVVFTFEMMVVTTKFAA